VPVGALIVGHQVREFRRLLEKRTAQEYLPHTQQLYNWLIRPIEPALASVHTDTVVDQPLASRMAGDSTSWAGPGSQADGVPGVDVPWRAFHR
jgi:hypothetical protein